MSPVRPSPATRPPSAMVRPVVRAIASSSCAGCRPLLHPRQGRASVRRDHFPRLDARRSHRQLTCVRRRRARPSGELGQGLEAHAEDRAFRWRRKRRGEIASRAETGGPTGTPRSPEGPRTHSPPGSGQCARGPIRRARLPEVPSRVAGWVEPVQASEAEAEIRRRSSPDNYGYNAMAAFC
jgi:hypothetical protein